jgi:hypothetical protein
MSTDARDRYRKASGLEGVGCWNMDTSLVGGSIVPHQKVVVRGSRAKGVTSLPVLNVTDVANGAGVQIPVLQVDAQGEESGAEVEEVGEPGKAVGKVLDDCPMKGLAR